MEQVLGFFTGLADEGDKGYCGDALGSYLEGPGREKGGGGSFGSPWFSGPGSC